VAIAGRAHFGKAVQLTSSFRRQRAQARPLRLAPLQQILCTRGTQMRPAILHHHLAVDVGSMVRDWEAFEIGEFAMLVADCLAALAMTS
jgi:hypothetical protein